MRVCVCASVCACMRAYVRACKYVCACMRTCVCVCVSMHACVCVHVCVLGALFACTECPRVHAMCEVVHVHVCVYFFWGASTHVDDLHIITVNVCVYH